MDCRRTEGIRLLASVLQRPEHPIKSILGVDDDDATKKEIRCEPDNQSLLTLPTEALNTSWTLNNCCSTVDVGRCLLILIGAPFMTFLLFLALEHHNGSLYDAFMGLPSTSLHQWPMLTIGASVGLVFWIVFQFVLYAIVPHQSVMGQPTQSGKSPVYRTNGFSAMVITVVVAAITASLSGSSAGWIADNWSGLVFATNLYGLALSAWAFWRGLVPPSSRNDSEYSSK